MKFVQKNWLLIVLAVLAIYLYKNYSQTGTLSGSGSVGVTNTSNAFTDLESQLNASLATLTGGSQ